jgi:hypothetical protein
MPAITPITMPAMPPPERPEFDAGGVEPAVFVAELAGFVAELARFVAELGVFVAELAGRVCEEKLEKLEEEDEDVLVPRIMVEMISGVPGSD